jgi:hypothetical protein
VTETGIVGGTETVIIVVAAHEECRNICRFEYIGHRIEQIRSVERVHLIAKQYGECRIFSAVPEISFQTPQLLVKIGKNGEIAFKSYTPRTYAPRIGTLLFTSSTPTFPPQYIRLKAAWYTLNNKNPPDRVDFYLNQLPA